MPYNWPQVCKSGNHDHVELTSQEGVKSKTNTPALQQGASAKSGVRGVENMSLKGCGTDEISKIKAFTLCISCNN